MLAVQLSGTFANTTYRPDISGALVLRLSIKSKEYTGIINMSCYIINKAGSNKHHISAKDKNMLPYFFRYETGFSLRKQSPNTRNFNKTVLRFWVV